MLGCHCDPSCYTVVCLGICTIWCALDLVDGLSIAIGWYSFCFIFYIELFGLHGFLVCITIVFLVSGFVIWP